MRCWPSWAWKTGLWSGRMCRRTIFPWASEVFFRISDVPLLDNVHTSVNFEQLMTYDPDMVYSFPRPNEEKQLEEAGVAYLPGEAAETLEDTPHQLMTYAQTLNE